MKENKIWMKGFTDKAIEVSGEDLFGIEKYIDGLTSFITLCETPMTMAIQGDWGSGKSSIMNMIREKLPENILPISFNTWEYSQFDLSDNLAISFLLYLSNKLRKEGGENLNEMADFLKKIGKFGTKALIALADYRTVGGGSVMNDIVNEYLNIDLDPVHEISNLKKKFQDAIDSICEKSRNGSIKRDKIVFFIDDLDRLQPARAVELLEVIKLFLDCDKCVFVLAIDYEIVSIGIKEKYGQLLDDKKGRKFFEKIIQIPFRVPVSDYNIEKYIKKTLEELKINDNDSGIYERLITYSVGRNPRAMKRAFNTYLLLSKIKIDVEQNMNKEKILFACLCMQQTYEKVYDYIVAHIEGNVKYQGEFVINKDTLQNLYENGISDNICGVELLELIDKDLDGQNLQLERFLKVFCELMLDDRKEKISNELFKSLQEVISIASVTSTDFFIKDDKAGRRTRKPKIYDENYHKRCPNARECKYVDSFNGMLVSSYKIGDNEKQYCINNSFNMSNFLAAVMEYAFDKKREDFIKLRKEALDEKFVDRKLYNLFTPVEGKLKRTITENQYEINCYSSNDDKMSQICQVFMNLGLNIEDIEIDMKEAHDI